MRAVYVLREMPSKCMECPFHQFIAFGLTAETRCVLRAKKNQDGINTKAEWCPLKSLPEEKNIQNVSANDFYDFGRAVGWNECLEEIEK